MDVEHQSLMRDELLHAWSNGTGDPKHADQRAHIISHQIMKDEDAARFHLATILKVANSPLAVPAANMILYSCYLDGWVLELDQAEALRRLEMAIGQGSMAAEWFLANHLLLINKKLSAVLPRDPDRALAILRRLSRQADDMVAMSLARNTFSSYIAANFHIDEISWQDRELITWHARDMQVSQRDCLALALFFARGQTGEDYAGPRYELSRKLLLKGAESRDPQTREACEAQLDAWGVKPVPEPEPTKSQKAVESIKLAGSLGAVAVVLAIWSVIGLALLSITAAINAFMLPILLIVLVIGAAKYLLRR